MTKKQKYLIYGVVSAIVLCLFVVGGTFFFRSGKQEVPKEEDSKPVIAEVTATPTPTPEPTKDPHEGQVRSSLTGKWVEKKIEKKRPFAVMINNIEYAFMHQMGTSKADIIYEALAEGGITRMMAVYQDISSVKKICSIRSARHYYVEFAQEWNAIYCHFGHTKYATSKMKKLKTNNISGLSAIGPVAYARTSSFSAPHNVYTSGKKLRKAAKKLKYSLKQNAKKVAEHFNFNEKDTVPDGKAAKKITIPFSAYSTCQMKYNKKKKTYAKYEYKKKHMDRYYKKQLTFKNIIIQLVDESNIDHNGYQTMKLKKNSGKGYYFSDGVKTSITWERNEKKNTMVYRDKAGNVLAINPGKTYIAVYPKNRKKLIQVKG